MPRKSKLEIRQCGELEQPIIPANTKLARTYMESLGAWMRSYTIHVFTQIAWSFDANGRLHVESLKRNIHTKF